MTSKNDKPEMPMRIWAETREPLAPLCQEGSWLQYAPVEWRINGSIVIPTEYLRADKVRELVIEANNQLEMWTSLSRYDLPDNMREQFEKWQDEVDSLFPDGVENEQDKD